MTVITSSFESDMVDAICQQVLTECGEGGTYTGPDYLFMQTARAGEIMPSIILESGEEEPAFLCEHLQYQQAAGSAMTRHQNQEHTIWLGAVFTATPESFDLETEPEPTVFRRYARASGDEFLARIEAALTKRGFAIDVRDDVHNRHTSRHEFRRRRVMRQRLSNVSWRLQVFLEMIVVVESDLG